ncbi:MAG: flagellar hook-length control protein FliK [Nitrospirae bacterium]|nr:flagellar hook-length control protein FliK [Nitrospirota bacterium]
MADPQLVLGNDAQQSDGIQILSSGSSKTVDKSGSGDLARAGGVHAPLSQGDTEKDSDTSLHGVALSAGSAVRTVAAADPGTAIRGDNDRPAEGDHLRDTANGMVIERGDPLDQAPVVGFDQVSGDGPVQEPRVPKESLIQNLAQRVTEQCGFLRSAGSHSWTVHVEPDSLGAVRLDISVHERGVTADITTTHPIMRELLDHHQGQLRQALADHGFSVDRFSVNVGDPEQRSSGQSWDRGGQSRPWAGPPEHGPVVRSTSSVSPFRHVSEGGALNVVNVYI